MSRKVYLETFGCQMNVLDSELVMGQLLARGYETTPERATADVVLFNTCSVREKAEQKVWSRLGEMRGSTQLVGVMGCMAERDGMDIYRKFPHVDLLCGPGELDKLPAMIDNHFVTDASDKQTALMGANVRRSSTLGAAEDNLELLDLARAISPGDDVKQSYVRITRGCNKFCTYCVVPYTRGPEVHRPPSNIIDEVKKLADAGSIEVTLLGQTINHYAFDHGDGRTTTFADLLYQIHEAVPHLSRLRFVTSYPRDFTDDALMAMRDCERICRYLHVPAQHGSNRVLKAMNRGYTIEQYDEFIDRAYGFMPDLALASDFIVGFPTETEDEFQACKDVIRRARFKNSFIFKYSPRPGTVAIGKFDDDIDDATKKRRNNELLAVQQEVADDVHKKLIGETLEVYVEGESKLVSKRQTNGVELGGGFRRRDDHVQLVARTRGDHIVVFDGDPALKHTLMHVKIREAKGLTLYAEAQSQAQSQALSHARAQTTNTNADGSSPMTVAAISSP